MKDTPKIAVLKWQEDLVPQGLMQLESLPGNSTNPDSYPFPVTFVSVPGACAETVIIHPSSAVLDSMIGLGKKLESNGVKAISTSCGFNAVFQQKLSNALNIPVFSSALLQIPFVRQLIGNDKSVAVITANKASLTDEHMIACGIDAAMNVKVFGLEGAREWSKIFTRPDEPFDMNAVEAEIVQTAVNAVSDNPDIGAIVLECTDLPPFAQKIREATGLPVFDFNSMSAYIAVALGEIKVY